MYLRRILNGERELRNDVNYNGLLQPMLRIIILQRELNYCINNDKGVKGE